MVRDPHIMQLVRALFYTAAHHNFIVYVHHLFGVDNNIAYALSRAQMSKFRCLAREANSSATPIHQPVWLKLTSK